MRYYDETIKRWKRVYHRGISEQIIFVTKETKNFIYGNSWNGRWKCDKTTMTWYQYDNYKWKERGGEFTPIGE